MATAAAHAAAASRLRYEEIKPTIGARVLNSKQELLSGELSDEINALLEQRGVIVFPKLDFSAEEQIAFSDILGGSTDEIGTEKGSIFKVSLDKEVNPYAAEYLRGSLTWHIDGTMNKMPVRGSMLTAIVLSPEGGDTEFANTASAYDDLDEDTKQKIKDLRVVHSLWNTGFYHTPEPTLAQLENWLSKGEAELPLVCTHKSGRKSLILGNTAHHVIGVHSMESARLLHGLRDFATQERYVYVHKWTLGDLVMWDNRTSLHHATPYDPESGRMMHRTILKGGEEWEQISA